MRYWAGVGAALGLGGVIGFVVGWVALEERLSKTYQESAESQLRAMKLGMINSLKEDENGLSFDFTITPDKEELTLVGPEMNIYDPKNQGKFTPAEVNPYHTTPQNIEETPKDTFVNGEKNEFGISYIEAEEFEEEDGRAKYRVEIIMHETNPIFTMDGVEIGDWDIRLGASILADMYEHIPPGVTPVLYVRNWASDEDYEVVQVSP